MDDDLESAHQHMLLQLRERAEFNYLKVRGQGVSQPVILLLDLHSELAQDICGQAHGKERVDDHIQEAERRGVEPVISWGMSHTEAARRLNNAAPEIAQRLLEPFPAEMFPAICISPLGISLGLLPCPVE